MKKRKVIEKVMTASGAAAGLTALTGYEMFRFALARNGGGEKMRKRFVRKAFKNGSPRPHEHDDPSYRESVKILAADFGNTVSEEVVNIQARDGIPLAGYIYRHPGSHKWAVCFHGYRADHTEIIRLGFAPHFYHAGYNVLIPDLRGSGKSGGKYIGMGWLEKEDVKCWIEEVKSLDPYPQVVLFGESMGAATVMAAAGDKPDPCVKAIIEDSGYAQVKDVLAVTLKKKFHLPEFPLLMISSLFCQAFAGYSLYQGDIAGQVSKSDIPILLFHGTDDAIVPFSNLQVLYDASQAEDKRMVKVEGAQHVKSSYVLGEEYWQIVKEFLDRHIQQER